MRAQQFWVAVADEATYDTERLYSHETVTIDGAGPADPQPGERVALLASAADGGLVLFGLGVVSAGPRVAVRYTHRLFDDPQPAGAYIAPAGSLSPVGETEFAELTAAVGPRHRIDSDREEWFVSVALPIEAASRAEAVREFWSYVEKLGPRELPAFVWPKGNELAMQAYVLGVETNLDPEEDDD